MAIQHAPLPPEYEKIAKIIVNAAYTVHKNLGPGLLEGVYEPCFCHELDKRGAENKQQVRVPLVYDGIKFAEALRLDVLVEDKIICELKVVEALAPVYTAQILTYLKLTEKRLGFLINFNVPIIKQGIKRIIL
jgi:GxxExxY protein